MFMSCLVNHVYNMWHATGELRSSDGSVQGGRTSQRDNLVTTLSGEINIIPVSSRSLNSAICPRHQPPPLKLHTLFKTQTANPRVPAPAPSLEFLSCVKNINKIPTPLLWLDTLTPALCRVHQYLPSRLPSQPESRFTIVTVKIFIPKVEFTV